MRGPRGILTVTVGLAACVVSSAYATTVQDGDLRVTILTQISPYKLPRTGTAPIAVFLAGHVAATAGGIPPQLQRMDIKVNRHGLLQSQGLPVCPMPRITSRDDQAFSSGRHDPPKPFYDPLVSGSTTIALAEPFVSLLASHGVRIETKAGAARRGSRIALPASGGEFDPALGAGTVASEGTIAFAAGKRKVTLRDLLFKARHTPLYAKVGGGQLKIATAGRLRAKREGFGERFAATGLWLTAKFATRLDKKLGLGSALSAGQALGSLTVRAVPATVHLEQEGRLSLAIDPAFAPKLNELFVSLNPIAPAELSPGPALSFPVAPESTLSPDGTGGTVKLEGAAELLQLGNAQVFWREAWLEPGIASLLAEADVEPSPPQSGRQPQGPLFTLPPGPNVTPDPSRRAIAISGQSATLAAATADSLNAAFAPGSSTFEAGETIGTLSLAAQAE